MTISSKLQEFGSAAELPTLSTVEDFIRNNAGKAEPRAQAAAFGLALAASQAVGETASFEDSLHVLDKVAKAKARIDAAAWHSIEVAKTTASVLLAAQTFLDEQTIPCTEWPTPLQVANAVLEAARRAAATNTLMSNQVPLCTPTSRPS